MFCQASKSQREGGLERERRTEGGKLYACLHSSEKHSKLKTLLQAIGYVKPGCKTLKHGFAMDLNMR